MKKYLKFVIAVFGITVSVFSNYNANAGSKGSATIVDIGGRSCVGGGICGYEKGKEIPGHNI